MTTNTALLPIHHRPEKYKNVDYLEALKQKGIEIINPKENDRFMKVALPEGWKVNEHLSMLQSLEDEKGRAQAAIPINSSSPNPKDTYLYFLPRFTMSDSIVEGMPEEKKHLWKERYAYPFHYEVKDALNTVAFTSSTCQMSLAEEITKENLAKYEWEYGEAGENARKECHDWLDTNYPDWKNPLAYWEEPVISN